MKAAAHELKGINAIYNCQIAGLFLPLTAMIDHKGFRLLAVAVIPIRKDTLVYGSSDACRTMHKSSREFAKKMANMAILLNLKGHNVNGTVIHGPGRYSCLFC